VEEALRELGSNELAELVVQLKDVNSFFGNLKNSGLYEGLWGNLTDDNRVWIGSRNGITFGRWDRNNPMVLAAKPLEESQYYVVAGRMGSGAGEVQIELFIDEPQAVASKAFPVNPKANSSKLAIGQERDALHVWPQDSLRLRCLGRSGRWPPASKRRWQANRNASIND
jgi:hypothetical protein